MKANEKAIELVERFKPYSDYNEDNCFNEVEKMLINAKHCALIAVDEIINIKGNLNFDYVWYEQRQTDINNWLDTESIIPIRIHALEYWQQVKEEINKL